MAKSGHGSSPPPSTSRLGGAPSKLQPLAAIQAEAQRAADEMVVDDYVDTYLRERPRTRNDLRAVVAAPVARQDDASTPRTAHARVEALTVRPTGAEVDTHAQIEEIGELEGDVVVLEAELADREERISSLEDEVAQLRRAGRRGASGAPVPKAPSAPAPPIAAQPPSRPAPAADPPARGTPVPPGRVPPGRVPPGRVPSGRGMGRTIAGISLVVLAASSLVAGLVLRAEAPAGGEVTSPSATATAAAPSAVATPASQAPAQPTAQPTAAPTAAPTAQPTVASAPEDTGALLSFQGYLTVRSSADAEVVVQGQPVGRTNQRILSRCGPRNVRLRRDGAWITGGEHVRIVCMKHTSLTLEPER